MCRVIQFNFDTPKLTIDCPNLILHCDTGVLRDLLGDGDRSHGALCSMQVSVGYFQSRVLAPS